MKYFTVSTKCSIFNEDYFIERYNDYETALNALYEYAKNNADGHKFDCHLMCHVDGVYPTLAWTYGAEVEFSNNYVFKTVGVKK